MWEYDAQHKSIITAGNGGTKPTRAAFTLFYNQGAEKYELEQTLQPDEQMWIDVGKLIREHVPDKNGKTLPADVTSGSFEVRDLTDTGVGSLFEGKVVYDKTYGHVTYGCSLCCGHQSPAFLDYNPFGIPFLDTSQNWVFAYDPCLDVNLDVTNYFYNHWGTLITAIATVNASGLHTGVGVGSTTTDTWGNVNSSTYRYCPVKTFPASGGDNVAAVPVNFHQTSVTDAGNGDLHFTYAWASSSGNLSDLSSCTVEEIVTYPGSANPFPFPSPPFPPDAYPNPTIVDLPATAGGFVDDHKLTPSTTFVKPYSASSFTATQYYRYNCTNLSGFYFNLQGPLSIVRSVSQNTNGTWKFTVTKPTLGVATINPLP